MRAVIVGAGAIAIIATELLLKRGHEVTIVESSKDRIRELSNELDCGFLLGDGSKPSLLREADPKNTNVLFCLTGNDHVNIIAGLVGQSLGFGRVVVKIEDLQFEHICLELGLKDMIIPARMTGRYLADMFEGQDLLELTAMIKDEARVFSFVLPSDKSPLVEDLHFPPETHIICIYRKNKFMLIDNHAKLQLNDEIVVITHRKNLEELNARWGPHANRLEDKEP